MANMSDTVREYKEILRGLGFTKEYMNSVPKPLRSGFYAFVQTSLEAGYTQLESVTRGSIAMHQQFLQHATEMLQTAASVQVPSLAILRMFLPNAVRNDTEDIEVLTRRQYENTHFHTEWE